MLDLSIIKNLKIKHTKKNYLSYLKLTITKDELNNTYLEGMTMELPLPQIRTQSLPPFKPNAVRPTTNKAERKM